MGPPINRDTVAPDQDIVVRLHETEPIEVGRSGQMMVDKRFKTGLPKGNLYLGGYGSSRSFNTHLSGQAVQAGSLDWFESLKSASVSTSKKTATGQPVNLSTQMDIIEKGNVGSFAMGNIAGNAAASVALALQKKYNRPKTLSEMKDMSPQEIAQDSMEFDFLIKFMNSKKLGAMFLNPKYYGAAHGYPSSKAGYVALRNVKGNRDSIENLVQNFNKANSLLKENDELNKLYHFRPGGTTSIKVGGKDVLETEHDYQIAQQYSKKLSQMQWKDPNKMTAADLQATLTELDQLNTEYNTIGAIPSNLRTIEQRIKYDSIDLKLGYLQKMYVDFSEMKKVKERISEGQEVQAWATQNKSDLDNWISDIRKVQGIKDKSLVGPAIDLLQSRAQSKINQVRIFGAKYPHIDQETNPPSADHLILANAMGNWQTLFRFISTNYRKFSLGYTDSIFRLPALKGYTAPSLIKIVPPPQKYPPPLLTGPKPDITFGSLLTTIDNQLKTQLGNKFSDIKAPNTADSNNIIIINEANSKTSSVFQTQDKVSTMDLVTLQTYIKNVREALGRQNLLNKSSATSRTEKAIDETAITRLQTLLIKTQTRYNVLEYSKEQIVKTGVANRKKIVISDREKMIVTVANGILDPVLASIRDSNEIVKLSKSNKWHIDPVNGGDVDVTNNKAFVEGEGATAISKATSILANANLKRSARSNKENQLEYITVLFKAYGISNAIDANKLTNKNSTKEYIELLNSLESQRSRIVYNLQAELSDYKTRWAPTAKPIITTQRRDIRTGTSGTKPSGTAGTAGTIETIGTKTQPSVTPGTPNDPLVKNAHPDVSKEGLSRSKVKPTAQELATTDKNAGTDDDPNFIEYLTNTTGGSITPKNYKKNLSETALKSLKAKWFKNEMKDAKFVDYVNKKGTNPKKLNADQKLSMYKEWRASLSKKLNDQRLKINFMVDQEGDKEELDKNYRYPFVLDRKGIKRYFRPYRIKDGLKISMTTFEIQAYHRIFRFDGYEEASLRRGTFIPYQFVDTLLPYIGGAVGAGMGFYQPTGSIFNMVIGKLYDVQQNLQQARERDRINLNNIEQERIISIKKNNALERIKKQKVNIEDDIKSGQNFVNYLQDEDIAPPEPRITGILTENPEPPIQASKIEAKRRRDEISTTNAQPMKGNEVIGKMNIRRTQYKIDQARLKIQEIQSRIPRPIKTYADSLLRDQEKMENMEALKYQKQILQSSYDERRELKKQPQMISNPQSILESIKAAKEREAQILHQKRNIVRLQERETQLIELEETTTRERDQAIRDELDLTQLLNRDKRDRNIELGLDLAQRATQATIGGTVGYEAVRQGMPLIQQGYDYIFPTHVAPGDLDRIEQERQETSIGQMDEEEYRDRLERDIANINNQERQGQDPPDPEPDPDPDPDDPEPMPDDDDDSEDEDDFEDGELNINIRRLGANQLERNSIELQTIKEAFKIAMKEAYKLSTANKKVILKHIETIELFINTKNIESVTDVFNKLTGYNVPAPTYKSYKKHGISPMDGYFVTFAEAIRFTAGGLKAIVETTTMADNAQRALVEGSRPLEEGETHYKNANFMGPGTIRKHVFGNIWKPLNAPDAGARQHDRDFWKIADLYDAKKITDNQRKRLIRAADERLIRTLKNMGEQSTAEDETYRQAGLRGIQSKNILENFSPYIAEKLLGEQLVGIDSKPEPGPAPEPREEAFKPPPLPQEPPGLLERLKQQQLKFKPPLPKEPPGLLERLKQQQIKFQNQEEQKRKKLRAVTFDTTQKISRYKLESMKDQKKQSVIHSNIYDIHNQFVYKPQVGFELDRKLKKKPFHVFQTPGNHNTTGFRELMHQTGSIHDIAKAQKKFKMIRNDPAFRKKKKRKDSEYKYKRII